ncbi:ectoine/hydroxyectoine ABC transporter permease subunit EhuC [Micromonospora echinospora]|nr:ectoine/hydroxyectoine ABC transporter permease subunit EhuC [Micromonospora echinospora]OZV75364.1 ectoine/hydroxyectoine ABC transporter permease subunit EhuC [Micromonospora echinospora]
MVEELLSGVPMTVAVFLLGSLLCIVVAAIAGFGRLSRWMIVRAAAGCFIEVFRGIPVIVQLYIAYYVLPVWGVSLSPFYASVVVIGVNCGAYGAEVVRGAILAVPAGQWEAAIALNFSRWQTFRRVVFTQAVEIMLPSLGTLLIDLLKTTAIVSLVTLVDVTFTAQQLRATTGNTAVIYGLVLVVYFVLASIIDIAVRSLERRFSRHRFHDGSRPDGAWWRGTALDKVVHRQ